MTTGVHSCRYHILLVEDNAADIYLLRQALERAGLTFDLSVIQDGDEALSFARNEAIPQAGTVPDLLVLDLNLPKVEGHDVLAALRQNVNLSNLTVVVITSSPAAQDHQRCTELGVARYLTKPLELDDFLELGAVVKQVLVETKSGEAK
jgi:CheY-like chemotaxis protein